MLMGPSKIFGLGENIVVVCIGMGTLGFIQSLCFVTALPEAMESIQQKYKIIEGHNKELDGKLNDSLSSFYTMSFNFSSLVGPLIGGAMFDLFEYRSTMDFNMMLELFFVVVFIYFNCGRKVFERNNSLKEDIKHLKEKGEELKKEKE